MCVILTPFNALVLGGIGLVIFYYVVRALNDIMVGFIRAILPPKEEPDPIEKLSRLPEPKKKTGKPLNETDAILDEALQRALTGRTKPQQPLIDAYLIGLRKVVDYEPPTKETRTAFVSALTDRLIAYFAYLPSLARTDATRSPFTVWLHDLTHRPYDGTDETDEYIQYQRRLILPYLVGLQEPPHPLEKLHIMQRYTGSALNDPVGKTLNDFQKRHRYQIELDEYEKNGGENTVYPYLADNYFRRLWSTRVVIPFPVKTRFAHTHILAHPDSGKTQLIQQLILYDLKSDDPPAIIVIDSQSDLINKLSHLRLKRDPILITPTDLPNLAAINIFDLSRARRAASSEVERQQIVAGAIQTYTYLFEGMGVDLTGHQSILFANLCTLMLALPRPATINDLIAICGDNPDPIYARAVEFLPPTIQTFFREDFNTKLFQDRKKEIRARLMGIARNPVMDAMFSAPESKIDFFDELNNGSFILIDTAHHILQNDTGHFGRLFITLIYQAILERAIIPEEKRRPAFLIVDEAHQYFDKSVRDLLVEARKYKVGCIFAHQYLHQATDNLTGALAIAGTKLVGMTSTSDARAMAPNMHIEAETLMANKKPLDFSCYIGGVTDKAIPIRVEAGLLEREPKLSDEEYRAYRERNRQRVSGKKAQQEPPIYEEPKAARQHPSYAPKGLPRPDPDVGTGTARDW